MTITDARKFAGQKIGLPASFDGSIAAYANLTAAQQIAVTQAMIAYIQANPGQFTPAQVETANVQAPQAATLTPEDDSFDFGQFFDELESNAIQKIGGPVASIGNGVSQTLTLIGTLLPAAVLVAVLIYAWPHIKNANR